LMTELAIELDGIVNIYHYEEITCFI